MVLIFYRWGRSKKASFHTCVPIQGTTLSGSCMIHGKVCHPASSGLEGKNSSFGIRGNFFSSSLSHRHWRIGTTRHECFPCSASSQLNTTLKSRDYPDPRGNGRTPRFKESPRAVDELIPIRILTRSLTLGSDSLRSWNPRKESQKRENTCFHESVFVRLHSIEII